MYVQEIIEEMGLSISREQRREVINCFLSIIEADAGFVDLVHLQVYLNSRSKKHPQMWGISFSNLDKAGTALLNELIEREIPLCLDP